MKHILLFFILITTVVFGEYPPSALQIKLKHSELISQECQLQIQCALGAFHAIKSKEIVYVSCPITSGQRLYDFMDANGYTTKKETEKDWNAFFHHVILPNIEESEKVSSRLSTSETVIAPTAFEMGVHSHNINSWEQKLLWGQHEFMSMWIPMIEKKITRMVMLDGWQYSGGSSEEYLTAVLMQMGFTDRSNINIVDANGDVLELDKGLKLLYEGVLNLQGRGLNSTSLRNLIGALLEAEQCYFEENRCRCGSCEDRTVFCSCHGSCDCTTCSGPLLHYNRAEVLKIAEEFQQ